MKIKRKFIISIAALSAIASLTLTQGCVSLATKEKSRTKKARLIDIKTKRIEEIRYDQYEFKGQVANVLRELMDNWYAVQGYTIGSIPPPRLLITEFDNKSDTYIPEEMYVRLFHEVAKENGSFTIAMGNTLRGVAKKEWLRASIADPNYSASSRPWPGQTVPAQVEVRIRLIKITTMGETSNIEDFEMTAAMYDVQTERILDCSVDVFEADVDYAF